MEKEKLMMLVLLVIVVIAGAQAVQLVQLENELETGGIVTGAAVAQQPARPSQQAQKPASTGMVGGC